MLMSMAQIFPNSSTVEAVEVTRRASICVCQIPTDVASPCVHCFREAGSCVSVQHAYLYCMRISCVCTCVFLVYTHDIHAAEGSAP